MLIVCPNCATPYQVDNSEIGDGRSARCVRCRTVWFAQAPAAAESPAPAAPSAAGAAAEPAGDEAVAAFRAELGAESAATEQPPAAENPEIADATAVAEKPPPAAAAEPPPEPSPEDADESNSPDEASETPTAPGAADDAAGDSPAVAPSEVSVPVEDAPPLAPVEHDDRAPASDTPAIDNGRDNIESAAARRRAHASASLRRAGPRPRLPATILALVALCAALLAWRKDVVRHMPQLASFYASIGLPVNLRGLAFADVKVASEMHDGVPVLVVEGEIVSTVSLPVQVPRLRLALRNAAGAEVYSWTTVPPQSILEPGKRLPFRSRLASPPKEGHDVQVRFFTRRDAVAALR